MSEPEYVLYRYDPDPDDGGFVIVRVKRGTAREVALALLAEQLPRVAPPSGPPPGGWSVDPEDEE